MDSMGNLLDAPIIRLQMAGQMSNLDMQISSALNNRYTHVCILEAMEANQSANSTEIPEAPMTADELHAQAVYFTAEGAEETGQSEQILPELLSRPPPLPLPDLEVSSEGDLVQGGHLVKFDLAQVVSDTILDQPTQTASNDDIQLVDISSPDSSGPIMSSMSSKKHGESNKPEEMDVTCDSPTAVEPEKEKNSNKAEGSQPEQISYSKIQYFHSTSNLNKIIKHKSITSLARHFTKTIKISNILKIHVISDSYNATSDEEYFNTDNTSNPTPPNDDRQDAESVVSGVSHSDELVPLPDVIARIKELQEDDFRRAKDVVTRAGACSSKPVDPSRPPPKSCLLYTSPSPRDRQKSRMPSSA